MKTVPEIENEDEFILTFAVAVKGAVEKLDAMREIEQAARLANAHDFKIIA